MRINEQLYLVVPLYRGEQPYAHAHALPIGVAAFDVYFELLVRAYQRMSESGYMAFRHARRFLRSEAGRTAPNEEAAEAAVAPLLNEIERLTTVVVVVRDEWQSVPLAQARMQGLLDEGDADEVVNAACFFTAAWHVPSPKVRDRVVDLCTKLWDARTSSSPPTAPSGGAATSSAGATTPPPSRPGATIIVPRRAS